jgi:two-component system, chemotaxis family, protein-glutamate methylesterase/glutaminase
MQLRIMVVDDSAITRALIARTLVYYPDMKLVATAGDGEAALEAAAHAEPDVILLDVEMPRMDGVTAIPLLLKAAPRTRIIMVSGVTSENARITLQALAAGAADSVQKPNSPDDVERFATELARKIRAVGNTAKASPTARLPLRTRPGKVLSQQIINKLVAKHQEPNTPLRPGRFRAVAIASSTGGPQALIKLFTAWNGRRFTIPLFITQHMPPVFTKLLAENLRRCSGMQVHEAEHGMMVEPGHVYVAPGDKHLLVVRGVGQPVLQLSDAPPVNSCRPSADVMFESISRAYGKQVLGLVLTGMGRDGCEGARIISEAGGTILAQDAASCVVYGMPRAVAESGMVHSVLSLDGISDYIQSHL